MGLTERDLPSFPPCLGRAALAERFSRFDRLDDQTSGGRNRRLLMIATNSPVGIGWRSADEGAQ